MRLLMRDETVVTVRWPDGGNKEAARGKRAQRKGARRMMDRRGVADGGVR
jgi:hypothetical protein